jgi:hypothetical protein
MEGGPPRRRLLASSELDARSRKPSELDVERWTLKLLQSSKSECRSTKQSQMNQISKQLQCPDKNVAISAFCLLKHYFKIRHSTFGFPADES